MPEPVGAEMSVFLRFFISGHAIACISVGASNSFLNHDATELWNSFKAIVIIIIDEAAFLTSGADAVLNSSV